MIATTATPRERVDVLYKAGRWTCIAGFALLFAYAIYLVSGTHGEPLETIFKKGVLDVVLMCAAVTCFLRGASQKGDRAIWFAFGFGSLMEAFGIYYHQFILSWDLTPPYPSPQDLFYLLVYPGWYVGMILLARKHLSDRRLSLWLHGVIGGLACAALAAALVFGRIVSTDGANTAAVATNLAYPIADTMLLALIVSAIALTGWRPGRRWALIAAGVAVFYAADIAFALQIAAGTYAPGSLLDTLWPLGMLLIGAAGYVHAKPAEKFNNEVRWMLVPSVAFASLALGIVIYGWVESVNTVAFWLAVATIGAMMIQFVLAMLENSRLLNSSRDDAATDQVTGLPNRRRLFRDLEHACRDARSDDPALLLMFDLNGFKAYNDRFGHMAGDVLLKRLGTRLRDAVRNYGLVYRLGGDEFCVLARVPHTETEAVTAIALTALCERGEGFETSSACGAALAPMDSRSPDELMRTADQRMYAQKHGDGSLDARHFDTVIRVIQRFAPMIDTHRDELLPIVRSTAKALDFSQTETDQIATAFEIRDIGYYAVPDELLGKPTALDEAERTLIMTHPVVGERLLAISPTLSGVATLVRSSHERVDGAGYPDGLAADAIPRGARLVCVAAAFDAMISNRAYRESLTTDEAVAELKRNAGTQFDASAAAAFCAEIERTDFVAGAGSDARKLSHALPQNN